MFAFGPGRMAIDAFILKEKKGYRPTLTPADCRGGVGVGERRDDQGKGDEDPDPKGGEPEQERGRECLGGGPEALPPPLAL